MTYSSFWNKTFPRILSLYANVIFVVLWVGFALALAMNQSWLDSLWAWVSALPTVTQIVVWVLFLPITVGLWIWDSPWSDLMRLAGLAGIVLWTFLALSSLIRAFR